MDSITGALDSLRDILFKPDSMLGKMMIKIRAGVKTFTTQKWVVGIKDTFVKGFNKIKAFLKPIGEFFKSIVTKGKMLIEKGKLATKIVGWAQGFGKLLGRLFLPITILMTAWDLITGGLEAWEKEGKEEDANIVTQMVAAIGGGLGKLAKNMIGIPLKYLGLGIAWIAEKLGFDSASKDIAEFAKKIPQFAYDFFAVPFNYLKQGINWIMSLFTGDPTPKLQALWTKLVGAGDWLANVVGTALDDIWEWFKGLFDIDFSSILSNLVPETAKKAFDVVGLGGIFGGEKKKKTVAELEGELKHKLSVIPQLQQQSEIKILRTQIADLQAKVAGGGVTHDTYTDLSQDNRQETKSTMVALTPTTPNSVIAALAMTP